MPSGKYSQRLCVAAMSGSALEVTMWPVPKLLGQSSYYYKTETILEE